MTTRKRRGVGDRIDWFRFWSRHPATPPALRCLGNTRGFSDGLLHLGEAGHDATAIMVKTGHKSMRTPSAKYAPGMPRLAAPETHSTRGSISSSGISRTANGPACRTTCWRPTI
jgi:hypothetical protein